MRRKTARRGPPAREAARRTAPRSGAASRRRRPPSSRSSAARASPATAGAGPRRARGRARASSRPGARSAAATAASTTRTTSPRTRREALVETLHGVRVEDPYRWLEAGGDPEVLAWSEAQGRHTREWLEQASAREAVRRRLVSLFSIGSLAAPVPRRGRYFYQKRTGDQQQPVLYVREGRDAPDRVLLDPAALSPDATTALDWYFPSPDGRLLAYGLSEGGSEQSTLRVRDVVSGSDLADTIPWTRACSLAWLPDA